LGVGGAVKGPESGAHFDGGLRVDVVLRPEVYCDPWSHKPCVSPFEKWGAGPFAEVRTLDFDHWDLTGGLVVATPLAFGILGGTLRVGGGYRWSDGGVLSTALSFGFRMPGLFRAEVVCGLYLENRVVFGPERIVELTAGVEVDPINFILWLAYPT